MKTVGNLEKPDPGYTIEDNQIVDFHSFKLFFKKICGSNTHISLFGCHSIDRHRHRGQKDSEEMRKKSRSVLMSSSLTDECNLLREYFQSTWLECRLLPCKMNIQMLIGHGVTSKMPHQKRMGLIRKDLFEDMNVTL